MFYFYFIVLALSQIRTCNINIWKLCHIYLFFSKVSDNWEEYAWDEIWDTNMNKVTIKLIITYTINIYF